MTKAIYLDLSTEGKPFEISPHSGNLSFSKTPCSLRIRGHIKLSIEYALEYATFFFQFKPRDKVNPSRVNSLKEREHRIYEAKSRTEIKIRNPSQMHVVSVTINSFFLRKWDESDNKT